MPGGWIFNQIDGGKNSLVLKDYDAPFGRPRQKPVVTKSMDVRMTENYYPGNSKPTRHIFGIKYKEYQIDGRFRDHVKGHGKGYALRKMKEVEQFVSEQQLCEIFWPGVVNVTGIISEFDAAIEGEGEIAWKMTIKIDSDNLIQAKVVKPKKKSPSNYSNNINEFFLTAFASVKGIKKMKGNLLDLLDNIITVATTIVGQMLNVTNQIASFEQATFAELGRLISIIGSIRQICLNIRDLFLDVPVELQNLSQKSQDQIGLMSAKSISNSNMALILKEMADFENDIEQTKIGKLKTTYIAIVNDTWESISIKFFNSSDKANELKDANDGIVKPIPGTEYFIIE